MTLILRDPTGKPPWPLTLIAGMQKAGKSFAAAQASASPLVDRTIWFPFGEDDPDEYGAIPGARFKIAQIDGTYRSLLNAMKAALKLETENPNYNPAHPDLWVLDAGGMVWEHIKDMAQAEANRRWLSRKNNEGKQLPEDGVRITSDLWNTASDRWSAIIELLLKHKGPSIITARMGLKMVVNDQGEPTKDKEWKVEAQKGLPFDVGVVVEMHARDEVYLSGVRSLRYKTTKAREPYPDFTMHKLWTDLGLADETPGERHRTHATAVDSQAADDDVIKQRYALMVEIRDQAKAARITTDQVAAKWLEEYGHDIRITTDLGALELMRDDLRAIANRPREDAVA